MTPQILNSYAQCYDFIFSSLELDFLSIREFESRCPDGPILEVGAGSGKLLNLGLDRELILVEDDPDMLTILRERLELNPSKGKYIEGNALRLPVPDESVAGVVYAINTLSEMSPILFALNEAHRVLKQDGFIYFVVENPSAVDKRTYRLKKKRDNNGKIYSYSLSMVPIPRLGKRAFQTKFEIHDENREHTFLVSHTLPTVHEWKSMLELVGFNGLSVFGSYMLDEFKEDDSHQILIFAQKRASAPANKTLPPAVEEYFDGLAPIYDQVVQKVEYKVPEWLYSFSSEFEGMHLRYLDLGCGNGIIGRTLQSYGLKGSYYGIDISKKMVQECRRYSGYNGVVTANLEEDVPLQEESYFHVVTVFGLTEFVGDIDKLLRRVRGLLAVGGECWISFEKTLQQTTPSGEIDPRINMRKYHYSREEIEKLVDSAGLRVIQMDERFSYFSSTYGANFFNFFVRLRRESF